jgi:plastocyanin domain-containing protein
MKNILMLSLFLVIGSTSFAADKVAAKNTETINVQVTEKGFEPAEINVKPGTHVILKVTRKTDQTCAMDVVIKEKNIKQALPLDKEVTVDVGTVKKGETKFSCAMDMITGHIISK